MLLYNQRDYVKSQRPPIEVEYSVPTPEARLARPLIVMITGTWLNLILATTVPKTFRKKQVRILPFGLDRLGVYPTKCSGMSFIREQCMKLRASHGYVGNDQMGQRFLFQSTVRTQGQSYYFGPNQELLSGMEEEAIGESSCYLGNRCEELISVLISDCSTTG